MATSTEAAVESLRQIKSIEPPVWLVPKQEISQAVRAASKHLFSSLKPHFPKSPFDQLLVEGFDAEQIWQQIDLQSKPLLSTLRREVKKFEKHPEEISKLKAVVEGGKVLEENETDDVVGDDDDDDDIDMDLHEDENEDEDEEDDDDKDEEEGEEKEKEKEKERGREEESESEGEEKGGGIEDKFLKIKELQEFLEEDEAREFGLNKKKKKMETKKDKEDIEEEEEEEEEDDNNDEENEDDNDEAEEEDELGLVDGDDEDDEHNLENARF